MNRILQLLFGLAICLGTQVNAQTLSEGFEGATFPPTNWDTLTNGIGSGFDWTTSTSSNNGSNAAFVRYENVTGLAEDWLITPLTAITAADSLVFWHKQSFTSDFGSVYSVRVCTTTQRDTANFTTLRTYNEPDFGTTYSSDTIDLSSYAGQSVYIAFVMTNDDGDSWFIDDVQIGFPSCFVPTNLHELSLTDSSASLNWVEAGTATEWEVEYDTTGFTLGNGNSMVVTDTFLNVSGLFAQSSYDWYVRAICGMGDTSAWTSVKNFTTPCATFVAPFSEDFTSFVPVCWNEADNGDLTSGPTNIGSGEWGANSGAARINLWNTGTSDWVLSPNIDLSAGGLELVVDARVYAFSGGGNSSMGTDDTVHVAISTDGGANWSSIFSWNAGNSPSNVLTQYIVDLSAYSGTSNIIGFLGSEGTTDDPEDFYFEFDNFEIRVPPMCAQPTDLKTTYIGSDSADFRWSEAGTATQWIVEYDTAGFSRGLGTIRPVSTDTFLYVGGLMPDTDYEWYVRAVCAAGDSSAWSGPFAFSTPCKPFSAPYVMNFDGGTVGDFNNAGIGCWTAIGPGANDIDIVTATDQGATIPTLPNTVELNDGIWPNDSAILVSPPFSDLSSGDNRIRFQAAFESTTPTNVSMFVGVMTDPNNSSTFIPLDTIDANDVGGTTSFGEIIIDLNRTALIGSSQFIAFAHGPGAFEAYVDSFVYEPIPTPFYPIAAINKEDTNGVADSLNVYCWTSGTVMGVDLDGNAGISFYISDLASGSQEGINVFNFNDVSNYVVREGDSIMVRGPIIQFNGLTEINADSILIIDTNATLPTPLQVTSFDESTESKLIEINDLVVITGSASGNFSYNMTASNGTDTLTIRVDSDTEVHDSLMNAPLLAGDTICSWIGVGAQFDNSNPFTDGYQMFAMFFDDLDTTTCVPVPLPFYPIATINTEDTNGVADSLNVHCWTSGTVVGVNLRSSSLDFTIIDQSSGMQEGIKVFNFNVINGYSVDEGDSLRVRGTVSQFNGLTQFTPDSIIIVDTNVTLPTPMSVNSLGENTESKWLSLASDFVLLGPSGGFSFNVDATNGTDTITIRVDSDTDIDDSLATNPWLPGDTICGLEGIGGQFDSSNPFTDGYQIFPMRYDDISVCKFVPPVVLPTYPIGTINTEDVNGVADSLNVRCWTSGTVIGVDIDGNAGLSFYISDLSSGSQEGINVFNFNDVSNYVVNQGDSILVRGTVIQFNGLTEINPDSISIIKTNATLPSPMQVTTFDESTESKLVEINDLVVITGSASGNFSYNMTASNGTDTLTIRVDSDTDVHDSLAVEPLAAGDTICSWIGVGNQFDNSNPFTSGYQMLAMFFSDLDTTSCQSVGINETKELESGFEIYPNPTKGEFVLNTSGFKNATVKLSIRDISGRVVEEELINNANQSFQRSYQLNENSKGIYFISIFDGDETIHKKLIIQ